MDIEKNITRDNRDALAETLVELCEKNFDIFALTSDVKYPTKIDKFAQKFPDRFFNLGIAEQNTIGVAAGLSTSGKIPFVVMLAVFATTRACEQVKTDLCYTNLNVKIVGVGAGLSFGIAGPTHFSTEDIAIMRSLPNMKVFVPADYLETKKVVQYAGECKGPVYIRIGRELEPMIYKEDYDFVPGKAVMLREGRDATIIATGKMVFESILASNELSKEGISCRVLNFHTIKPIDEDAITKAAKETKVIVSVEEHTILGGLGSAVSEVLAETNANVSFKRIGIKDVFVIPGEPEVLRLKYGLNCDGIVMTVKKLLNKI